MTPDRGLSRSYLPAVPLNRTEGAWFHDEYMGPFAFVGGIGTFRYLLAIWFPGPDGAFGEKQRSVFDGIYLELGERPVLMRFTVTVVHLPAGPKR